MSTIRSNTMRAFAAIHTCFLGPTNRRGSRVKATCHAGSVIVAWDYAFDAPTNHARAAMALAEKLEWPGAWFAGSTGSAGYAFVCIGDTDPRSAFEVSAKED